MAYEFRSKYQKTPTFSPHEKTCCHHPEKKTQKASQNTGEKSSGEYNYQSRYSQQPTDASGHYCCHHDDDFHHQSGYLQEKHSQQQQQKSIDFIRQRREEEAKKEGNQDVE